MTLQNIILLVATTSTALVAGLMYAYAVSVNNGLKKLADNHYIAAMQSINREIQNPSFFVGFAGSLLLLPLAAWFEYKTGFGNTFRLLFAASIIYAVGVFGVTLAGNAPLNEVLDRFILPGANDAAIGQQRLLFEKPWNRLHNIRTIAAIISLVLVISACLCRSGRLNV